MANNSQIKALINEKITTNGTGAITGSELNNVLKSIVDTLGVGSRFCGSINTSSSITEPDGNVFYFATQGGTYANCGNVTIQDGLAIIKWENGAWGALQLLWYDSVPTPNSSHLVLSGGLYQTLKELENRLGGNDKGTFTSVENLRNAFPSPRVGWKALVGNESPLDLYICETDNVWSDSGITVDVDYGDLSTKEDIDRLDNTNGMAKIVIKASASFASQLTQANTTYVIRNNFDLDSGSVTIPTGCVLKFEGGSLSNGTITGQDTVIEATDKQILNSVSLSGTFSGALNAMWIGAVPNDNTANNSEVLQGWISNYSGVFKTIEFPSNTYYFMTPVAMSGDLRNREIKGNNSKFLVNIPDVNSVGQYFLTITGEKFSIKDVYISSTRKTSTYSISKTRCLNFNGAQMFLVSNVEIYYFDIAINLKDVWYGTFEGSNRLFNNRIAIHGEAGSSVEINTIDFSNIRIRGASEESCVALLPQESGETDSSYKQRKGSCGVDFHCMTNNCKFNGMVIEGTDYGIRFNRMARASRATSTGLLNIYDCYFEANRVYDIYIGWGYVYNPNNLSNYYIFLYKALIYGCLFHTLKKVYLDNCDAVILGCYEPITLLVGSAYTQSTILYDKNVNTDYQRAKQISSSWEVCNKDGTYTSTFATMMDYLESQEADAVSLYSLKSDDSLTTNLTSSNAAVGRAVNEYAVGRHANIRIQQIIQPLHVKRMMLPSNSTIVEIPSGGSYRSAVASFAYAQKVIHTYNGISLYEFLRRWDAGVEYTGKVNNLFNEEITANPSTGLIKNSSNTVVGFGKKALVDGSIGSTTAYYIDVDTLCVVRYSYNKLKQHSDLVQCGRTFLEIMPSIDASSTTAYCRGYTGTESNRNSTIAKRINAIYYNTTSGKYEIFNGFEWVELTSRTQRYVYTGSGVSLSGRAAMADFPGQTYYNEATGITYTFYCNTSKTSWGWRTSIGVVDSLDHPNGYNASSNPVAYSTELTAGECVICNGELYKWDGTGWGDSTGTSV